MRSKFFFWIFSFGIIIGLCAFSVLYLSRPFKEGLPIDYSDRRYYIAHAGGEIDGHAYTNSKEALLASLEKGYQYVELDFDMTSDTFLVCAHGASVFNKMTNGRSTDSMPCLGEFRSRKIYGQFTPLIAKDVIDLMKSRRFTLLVDLCSDPVVIDQYFSELKDRIIIESSSISNYTGLKKRGYVTVFSMGHVNVKNILLLLSCRIISNTPIDYITVSTDCNYNTLRCLKRLFGFQVFAFTCNSVTYLHEHLGKEVDKVYTDSL